MKLKKKHFKKLKEIAVTVNQIFPGTGVRLDKLIAEIESVQKRPVNQIVDESLLAESNSIHNVIKEALKQQKNRLDSVANINNNRPSIQDKKKYKEYIMDRVYSQHRKDVEANILKEGKAMVAASTDEGTEFEGGLCGAIEIEVTDKKEPLIVEIEKDFLVELYNFAVIQATKNGTMDELLDIDRRINSPSGTKFNQNTDPKIGDVGYFWDDPCISAVFGKLDLVLESYPVKYQVTLNGDFTRNFKNFSKTPPELK